MSLNHKVVGQLLDRIYHIIQHSFSLPSIILINYTYSCHRLVTAFENFRAAICVNNLL